MKIIETTFERLPRERLVIGFEGENLRATVRIDCASVFAEYPNATPALIVKPLFAAAYPVVVDRNGTDVDWLITSEILSFNGDGEIQLIFYKDQVICKSAVSKIRVSRSLTVTGDMPDPVVQWIEDANRKLAEVDAQIVELEEMVDTATDAATRAQQSETNATAKATEAATSAATASAKAAEAQASANTATAKASEAALSATQARNSAMSAANSESGATAKAAEAAQSAQTAAQKAEQITEAAQIATGKAEEASASATAAQTSATNAASSATAAQAAQTAAKASETAAGASATQAAQSAQTANTAAQTATQKAGEAATSATNAATSATNAATSAETASTKAGEAAQSAQAVEETAEQLAESLEQISQNTADIAEHEQEYNALKEATLIHNTASGSIASFVDGAEMPVDEVTVQIEPVQDLHGYDHPWPAGGGENILDPNIKFTAGTYFGGAVVSTSDGYNITLSGTPTESGNITTNLIAVSDAVVLPAGTYTSVGGIFSTYKPDGSWYTNRQVGTWTADSDFIVRQIYIQAAANSPVSGSRFIALIKGSTAPTEWTPYSNICPISGWDGVQVWDDPKYGWNIEWNQLVNGYWVRDTTRGLTTAESGNGYSVAGTVTTAFDYNFVGLTNLIRFHRDGRKYLITVDTATLGDHLWRVGGYSVVALHNGGFMFTQTATADWNNNIGVNIELGETVNDTGIIGVYDLTQMFGATKANEIYAMEQAESGAGVAYFRSLFPADYYPYNAGEITTVSAVNDNPYRHYSITLPTEAGTVYGGTLTIAEDGSGVLTVDRAMVDMGNMVWNYNTTYAFFTSQSIPDRKIGVLNLWSDLFKTMAGSWSGTPVQNALWGNGSNATLYVQTPPLDNVNDFMALVDGHQLMYEFATPITYNLTASEIRTLLGQNNIWADTGDVSVKYKADTKLYIDGKIAELVAQIVNS